MSLAVLPPPPASTQLTARWLRSPEGKALLASYLAAVYAQQNLQVVVIKNGVRQPPVTPRFTSSTGVLEITV